MLTFDNNLSLVLVVFEFPVLPESPNFYSYLLSAEGPRAALQLLSDKVRHARSFLGNAHVGAEHNYSDPRYQRTGVVFTLKTRHRKRS
jgi:hypothetical protein